MAQVQPPYHARTGKAYHIPHRKSLRFINYTAHSSHQPPPLGTGTLPLAGLSLSLSPPTLAPQAPRSVRAAAPRPWPPAAPAEPVSRRRRRGVGRASPTSPRLSSGCAPTLRGAASAAVLGDLVRLLIWRLVFVPVCPLLVGYLKSAYGEGGGAYIRLPSAMTAGLMMRGH
jgi:hypothetical protein